MASRTTNSVVRNRSRTMPHSMPNTQPAFENDLDEFDAIENDLDESSPVVRDVPFYGQYQQRSSVHRSNHNQTTGTYYTPQLKRKRVQDQMRHSPVKTIENTMEDMLIELNRKIDLIQKREDQFEKKMNSFYKRVRNYFREGHKYPIPCEPPSQLPIIEYNGQNLLTGSSCPTPALLMKRLINQLFSKEEMMQRVHEQANERTEKIKEAIQEYFYGGDEEKANSFWENEGKVIRGNQRRGHIFRQGHPEAN